ncbi:MAG: N-acetyltransferase [Alphaproteobacteria bacterium]
MQIRAATPADADAVWAIMAPIIAAGETYALPRDMSRDDALAFWGGPGNSVYVAVEGAEVLGTYMLHANQAGGGAHVSNCGFMTAPSAAGRGVARAMCAHALDEARRLGFRAMQFNFVVSTNTRAVALWRGMGFDIVGTLPRAFLHPTEGEVDVYVMFRRL